MFDAANLLLVAYIVLLAACVWVNEPICYVLPFTLILLSFYEPTGMWMIQHPWLTFMLVTFVMLPLFVYGINRRQTADRRYYTKQIHDVVNQWFNVTTFNRIEHERDDTYVIVKLYFKRPVSDMHVEPSYGGGPKEAR